MRRCTGLRPSRTSGSARDVITLSVIEVPRASRFRQRQVLDESVAPRPPRLILTAPAVPLGHRLALVPVPKSSNPEIIRQIKSGLAESTIAVSASRLQSILYEISSGAEVESRKHEFS